MLISKSYSITCRSMSKGEETRLNKDEPSKDEPSKDEPSKVKVRLRSQARQEGKDVALLDKHNVTIEPVHQVG